MNSLMEVKHQLSLTQGQLMIKQCQDSGMTTVAWCAENGISRWKYNYWLKKVREAAYENMMIGGGPLPATLRETSAFAELKQPACGAKAAITLKMDGYEIEIHNGADGEVIVNTIRALKSKC